MLLIDSLYINNSGGKVLLEYLVEELEKKEVKPFYLFDKRCEGDFPDIPLQRKIFLEPRFINRWKFYRANHQFFTIVFCFANTPPPLRVKGKVYTYFHNTLLVDIPKHYSWKKRFKVQAQKRLSQFFKTNSDFWIVQSQNVKELIKNGLNVHKDSVLVLPFYKILPQPLQKSQRNKGTFIYVSTGANHKNHSRLLQAWKSLAKEKTYPILYLTIPEHNQNLLKQIEECIDAGAIIINKGVLPYDEIMKLYLTVEYIIHPSLTESFGLPLIEGTYYGCKVVGADLAYTHAALQASITFNPYSVKSIETVVKKAMNRKLPPTVIRTENKIQDLISLIR